jgi:alpha/beta superfamily hydrolase
MLLFVGNRASGTMSSSGPRQFLGSDALNIPSASGSLETWLERPAAPSGICAVLCHPHPLYGGSMHDGVLDCLARALLDAGVSCLRFNFRGVGASSGSYDGGEGEMDDLLAAIRWIESNEAPTELWLGGYSFGAFIVWESLAKGPAPARVLLVAPPVGRIPFTSRLPGCRVDVFAGDGDEFVDQAILAGWTSVNTHLIADADHFFTGCRDDLQRRIELAID